MRHYLDVKSKTRVAAVAFIAALFAVSSLHIVTAQETVALETADPFAILAGSTVTNDGSSHITGDIGLHPGTSITGFGDATVDGDFHIADEVAEKAKADLLNAYNDAFARPTNDTLATELGGNEVLPGVYDSSAGTFEITNELTLNAQGDPDAVWIFKMASTLTTAVDSSVLLTNGAQACNVFWQVGSSATINDGSDVKGNVLAQTSISMKDGAALEGRALALDGAVTLIKNDIAIAECDDPPADDPPADDPPADDPPAGDPPGAEPPLVCSTGLMASANEDKSITLTWNPIDGAQQYRIHRAIGGNPLDLHDEVDGNATSFTDTDTEVDISYRYEVRPVVDGVELEDCDRVEVTAIPFFPGFLTGALALLGAVVAYTVSRRRTWVSG